MTVSPTVVATGATNDFVFHFRANKSGFNPGSLATLLIPSGWTAPQANNSSGAGYVSVTPVLNKSTASLVGISGSGPWTITVIFSTSQKQGGFDLNYSSVTAPTNAAIYWFTTRTEQSGGVFKTLKSGSPSVTVNTPLKTNTTTSVISAINPCTYGQSVAFTATVTTSGPGTLSGTLTFRDGDLILGEVPLDGSGQASLSTNRFSVPDSPSSITAEYNGNTAFNGSISTALLEDVSAAPVVLSGLASPDKVYDGSSAAFLDTNAVSLSGALSGDDVGVDTSAATASFQDANSGAQKTVSVTGLSLMGADAGNYVVDPTATLSANILPASLLVTANDTNRYFGAANPAFTASYSGFVGGEDPSVLSGSPAFSTPADVSSPVAGNPYPIIVTTGTLSATNYTFVFQPGLLTILPGAGLAQRIVAITKLDDGSLKVDCSGAAGQMYLLQASGDLSSSAWSTIATNTTDINGLMSCTDSAATNFASRFYRTAMP